MKHPEVFLVPVLMFADYYLTIIGNILRNKNYSKYFTLEHYELNPDFQKDIYEKKLFNIRHIAYTILFTAMLFVLYLSEDNYIFWAEGLFGFFVVLYGTIVGRHLANLLIFQYLERHLDEISGHIKMTHAMSLYFSTYQYLTVFIPMCLLVIFCPSPFSIGGALGVVMLFVYHYSWIQRYKETVQDQSIPEPPAS